MDKKFRRATKNEANHDISADVFQWFNKHCTDILNDGYSDVKDLEWDLKGADVSEWIDEVMLDLESEFGYNADSLEDYRDQIEYDLEKLIKETLDRIKYGDVSGLQFAKTKSDWVDKYANPDEYTASLESRIRKLESRLKNEDLDTANDMQIECARNVSYLANKIDDVSADIIEQAEDSGDEKLATAVRRMMRELRFIKFYLSHRLR